MNKEIMKRLPFAETNVEGIELWLDQMALEGLFLCDTAGTSWYFREGEPEAIRYRLDKVTEKGAMPSVEKRESYQKKGWKYLLTHKTMYHIFQAKDPQAEELHMDGLEESLTDNIPVESDTLHSICRRRVLALPDDRICIFSVSSLIHRIAGF